MPSETIGITPALAMHACRGQHQSLITALGNLIKERLACVTSEAQQAARMIVDVRIDAQRYLIMKKS